MTLTPSNSDKLARLERWTSYGTDSSPNLVANFVLPHRTQQLVKLWICTSKMFHALDKQPTVRRQKVLKWSGSDTRQDLIATIYLSNGIYNGPALLRVILQQVSEFLKSPEVFVVVSRVLWRVLESDPSSGEVVYFFSSHVRHQELVAVVTAWA